MGNNRMTYRPRRWSVVKAAAVVALLAAVAAGCGSDDGSEGQASTSSPSLETTSSSQALGTAAITPPGTHLALGQPAFIQMSVNGVQGIVSIAIAGITEGTPAERAQLNFPSGDAYYVTMVIANTGSPADMGDYEPVVDAVQEDGAQAFSVNEPDDFAPCPDHGPTELALGASFYTCEAYIALPGVKVTSVSYISGPRIEPITWS
jgi:hypothetical protein